MKIRTGFVSNSSSSSFCLLGLSFETENDAPKREKSKLDFEYACNDGDDFVYLGLKPEKMNNEETLLQFKQRIVDEFAKDGYVTTVEKLSWHTDGGYNG